MKKNSCVTVYLGVLLLFLVECKSPKNDSVPLITADRKPLVTNLGNNIIVPRYLALNTAINDFDMQVQVFIGSPSVSNLNELRARFYVAYKSWEYVSSFEFGPATSSNVNLGTKMVNAFPADTSVIKNKISQGVTNIPVTNSASYSGFPAIDYLLFQKSLTDAQIVDSFQVSSVASNRRDYLKTLSSNLKSRINTTYTNWVSGDNFVLLFINNTGLDLGSSTSQTINMMVADLENIKNFKLGLPLNIVQNIVINGSFVYPFRCEGYHSDSSLVLAKTSMEALRKLFKGISEDGIDGQGFDDYLDAIGRDALKVQIENQIELIQSKLNLISDPISVAIQNPAGKQLVNDAYTEMLNLIVLLKVDLPSAVGVVISYGDTDGD